MDRPFGNEGALTGDTAKTVMEAPELGRQHVLPASGLSICNADDVAHDFTFQKRKGMDVFPFWIEGAVAAGEHIVLPKKVVLDAIDETLEVVMEADENSTPPTFDLAALESQDVAGEEVS